MPDIANTRRPSPGDAVDAITIASLSLCPVDRLSPGRGKSGLSCRSRAPSAQRLIGSGDQPVAIDGKNGEPRLRPVAQIVRQRRGAAEQRDAVGPPRKRRLDALAEAGRGDFVERGERRDPYTETPEAGQVNLWWDDNLHASKFGSYLSALTLFGTITGLDPRALGAGDSAAAELGVDPAVAAALQDVAAATVGFSLDAHWTAPGRVTELQGTATGTLASAGAFSFADTDAAAVHAVEVSPVTVGAYGALTASLQSDTTGDGSGGAVNWTYTVDNADIEFLVAGQTRVERFLVTLTDQNGDKAEREIAVTLTGVNDGTEDGQNIIRGKTGADEFFGLGGDDQLRGKGGDDRLIGGDGDDLLVGGAGDDGLIGGRNDDFLSGGAGDDVLEGRKGNDQLKGRAGDDTLDGGDGEDLANGGGGDDTFVVSSLADGRDAYDGGAGSDTIDLSALTGRVALRLGSGTTRHASDTLDSIENVAGGAAADRLAGNALENVLSGQAGDDRLSGGGGDDRLIGGAGDDDLTGGGGSDAWELESETPSCNVRSRLVNRRMRPCPNRGFSLARRRPADP